MDLLLICKDGSASSLTTNLLWASEARKNGVDAGILFSSEALSAFSSGAFLWPRELANMDARIVIADNAKSRDLPISLGGQARQLDVNALFARAQQAALPMYADPIWTDLLGLRGKLPAGIAELETPAGLDLVRDAKTVVGSL